METFLRRAHDVLGNAGGMVIESLLHREGDLVLEIRLGESAKKVETWKVVIRHAVEHRVELGWCGAPALRVSHPLLWPHQDPWGDLYFHFPDGPPNPKTAIGRLWERHHRDTEGWLPFERFLNPSSELGSLLEFGAGLLAQGPVRLLSAYGEELALLGAGANILNQRPAVFWKPTSDMTGAEWAAGDRPLKVLTLGESYLVAADFIAAKE